MINQGWQPDGELLFTFRPRLHADESLAGYLLHFASENVLAGLRGLARFSAVSPWELFEIDRSQLAHALWGHQCERRSDYTLFMQAAVPQRYGARALRRVCPMCLQDENTRYAQAAWDQPMSTHCKKHRVLLRHVCASCRQPLDYMVDQAVGTCSCGAALAEQECHTAPGWMPYVHLALDPKTCAAPHGDLTAEGTAAQVLQQICGLSSSRNHKAVAATDSLELPFATEDAIAAAEPWFVNWPHGFSASLRRRGYKPGEELPINLAKHIGKGIFPDIDEAIQLHEASAKIRSGKVRVQLAGHATAGENASSGGRDDFIVHYPFAFIPCPFGGLSSGARRRVAASDNSPAEGYTERPASLRNDSPQRLTGMLPRLVLMWLTTRTVERAHVLTWTDLAFFVRRLGFRAEGWGPKSPAVRIRDTLEMLLASDMSQLAADEGKDATVSGSEVRVGRLLEASRPRKHQNLVLTSDWFRETVCLRTFSFNSSTFRALSASRIAQLLYVSAEARLAKHSEDTVHVTDLARDVGLDYVHIRKLRSSVAPALEVLKNLCEPIEFRAAYDEVYIKRPAK